jgi:hypothetical protein
MATKNIKKGKDPATAVDPFAAIVESSDKSDKTVAPQKPKRPIKVIKAAKTAASTSETAKAPISTSKSSSTPNDAFAEIAKPAAEDQVELELPTTPQKARGRATEPTGAAKRSTSKVKTTPSAVEKPDVPETPAKRPSISRKNTTRSVITAPTSATAVGKVKAAAGQTGEIAKAKPKVELSPVFKALADVKLPELPRENRARLQMQSPTRLYFYWSLKQNPWQQLRAVFGPELGSYTLVVKLRNLNTATEEIHPIETQGEWWFNDAEPDTEYVAEIGFYATNRPYFRLLYSNSLTTPRRSPSTHPATEARWTVSATKFAEVLDASGFTRDALDVAIAGDDPRDAEQRTNLAFSDLMTGAEYSAKGISAEDMRHAMLALAGGAAIEKLRHRVNPLLFTVLQANAERLSSSRARKVLTEHFDVDDEELTEHEFGPAVFGASLLNFPKTLRSRSLPKLSASYNPVSSSTLGR